MCLCGEQHDVLEVRVVDVRVHPEQPLENHLYYRHEVLRERHPNGAGEDLLVVQLVFHPGHEEVNVLAGAHLERRLHVVTVCPQVLVLGARAHSGTRLGRAELGQDSVEHVDFVVELDRVDCKPLVEVLTGRQLDGQLHVAAAKRHARDLLKSVAARSLLDLLLLLEGLGLVDARNQLGLRFGFH